MQNSKDEQMWKVSQTYLHLKNLWFWRNLNVISYKQIFPQLSSTLKEYGNKDTVKRQKQD